MHKPGYAEAYEAAKGPQGDEPAILIWRNASGEWVAKADHVPDAVLEALLRQLRAH